MRRAVLGLLVLLVGLVACVEEGALAPSAPSQVTAAGGSETAHFGPAVEQIARALAIALGKESDRLSLRDALRESPFPEHKLTVQGVLRSPGHTIFESMHAATGGWGLDVDALIGDLPLLEVYFPVPEHRNTWTGGENLLVAVQRFDEDDAPAAVAYDLRGTRLTLVGSSPPSTPTLVVGLAEIDFSAIPDRTGWRNTFAADGAVGSWGVDPVYRSLYSLAEECDPEMAVDECSEEDGSGGGAWAPPADAVFTRDSGVREFVDQMWTPNDHEPWNKGAPEFRLFIAGTNDTDGADELHMSWNVPEDPWAGSDDELNSKPRAFGPYYLKVADYGYWGDRFHIRCIENDADISADALTISGEVKFTDSLSGTVTVNLSAIWNDVLGGNDDDCGTDYILLTGTWTRIFSRHDDWKTDWHGTNDLRWNGWGKQY